MGRCILPEFSPTISEAGEFQVITPSKAIASYLQVPHYSLESLTQNMVRRRGMGVASALLSRRLLQNAVKEVIDTRDVEGTAKAFLSTIKDLFRSGVDLTKLQQVADRRIQQLARLAAVYQGNLRQVQRIDGAELYWQGVQVRDYQKAYVFYGYLAPARDELALINAIAGSGSILVLPSAELYPQNQQAVQWLQSQGWSIDFLQKSGKGVTGKGERNEYQRKEEQKNTFASGLMVTSESVASSGINHQLQQCFQQTAALPSGVSLHVFPDLDAEIRGVLSQVKVLLNQGIRTQDIVLVTKDEQLYGDRLIDLAWEYNLPVEVSYDISLEQTRLGAWLKLLLEVVKDNFPFEATAKLLSHPLSNLMTEEIWVNVRQNHPHGLIAWQNLEVDLSLLDWQGSQQRSIWIDRLEQILTTWDVLENARFWAREIVAYYRLQSALQELGHPATQQLSKAAFSSEIEEILALLTIPAQPGRGGIPLHTPTALSGTNYPYVLVLGAAEGILPAAIANEVILDFQARKQLVQQGFNLKTAVDLARQETWDFYCLLNVPTKSIVFSYPELIGQNTILPSPYLSRLGLKPTPVDNLPVASMEQARQLYLRQPELLTTVDGISLNLAAITHQWQVESRRESAIAPDQYDGIIGIRIDAQSKVFSASQLTQLGQCPFKWFSAKLLKLKKLTEAESDLSAAVRGVLYHRCLELALAQVKTARDLAQFNQQQLAQVFTIAEQELNLTELPGWHGQRQEHLDLLTLNLTTAEFLPSDRQVVATETKFKMQWHGLEIQGQVDRIDRTPTGLTVIDYKTSGNIPPGVKDDTGKANLDVQLAVYQDAIAQLYPEETIDTTAYYSLSQQKTISRPPKNPTDLATFAEKVKSHLEQGYYPVAPDSDRQACRYCDYDLVCRQGDRLSRKNVDDRPN